MTNKTMTKMKNDEKDENCLRNGRKLKKELQELKKKPEVVIQRK